MDFFKLSVTFEPPYAYIYCRRLPTFFLRDDCCTLGLTVLGRCTSSYGGEAGAEVTISYKNHFFPILTFI